MQGRAQTILDVLKEISFQIQHELFPYTTPLYLIENFSYEIDVYWQMYKVIFTKIYKTIKFSIREINYGIYDSGYFIVSYTHIQEIINILSRYTNMF